MATALTIVSDKHQFYTYLHCKPDGSPFYVGKGKGNRHLKFKDGRNSFYKNIVAKYGSKNIEVYVFPRVSEQEAFETEIRWIAQLRAQGYKLANITSGGEGTSGTSWSEEKRISMSESAKGNKYGLGHKHTEEAKRKISEASKGNKYNLGRIPSDETRLKMSLARKGKKRGPLTAEVKEKIKLGRAGVIPKISEEERKRRSERMMGNKYGVGLKTKGHTGRNFSEDHRKNISFALKKRWAIARGDL